MKARFAQNHVHRPDFVDVTTRTSHHDGFIKIGAGFIEHDSSLYPALDAEDSFTILKCQMEHF
jgi:hypothetical protein